MEAAARRAGSCRLSPNPKPASASLLADRPVDRRQQCAPTTVRCESALTDPPRRRRDRHVTLYYSSVLGAGAHRFRDPDADSDEGVWFGTSPPAKSTAADRRVTAVVRTILAGVAVLPLLGYRRGTLETDVDTTRPRHPSRLDCTRRTPGRNRADNRIDRPRVRPGEITVEHRAIPLPGPGFWNIGRPDATNRGP